jgi:hypothetical protein
MTVGYPMFLIVVGGLLSLGVFAIPTGVLAIRFGLERGIKAIIIRFLIPVLFLGFAALLLWVNPVEGIYKVGIWYVPIAVLGPFIGVYDLYRVFKGRREAREEAERAAQRPSYDLSKVRLPPMD